MKKIILSFIILIALSSPAAVRELNESWKVEVGQSKKQAIKFFQAESVKLTETFTQNGRAVDLRGTNIVVVWEINGWSDYTNTYAIATGTVSSASNVVTFALSPEQSNLSASNYLGFVRALQSDGTNLSEIAVLAYQTIAVEWSPDSRHYATRGPLTYKIEFSDDAITNYFWEVLSAKQDASTAATDADLAAHTGSTNNPHAVTKAQVGLGGVDNTADLDKPVSTAQAQTNAALLAAIGTKQDASTAATDAELAAHTGSTNNPHAVTKAQVGLGSVNNTADADKPISTAQALTNSALQEAIGTNAQQINTVSGRVDQVESDLGGVSNDLSGHMNDYENPHGVYPEQIGLGNVDNTSDYDKPISAAQALTNAALQSALSSVQSNVLTSAAGVWRASTDRAYLTLGTNRCWIFCTALPTGTVYNAVSWSVTDTNAWFLIGTNRVEVRP
jgi:hypothetical protein